MDAKQLFLKNKDLRDRWSAITHSSWFGEILVYARSAFMDGAVTEAQLKGAKDYEQILCSLCDGEAGEAPAIFTGLNHNLDNPSPPKRTPPKPEPK